MSDGVGEGGEAEGREGEEGEWSREGEGRTYAAAADGGEVECGGGAAADAAERGYKGEEGISGAAAGDANESEAGAESEYDEPYDWSPSSQLLQNRMNHHILRCTPHEIGPRSFFLEIFLYFGDIIHL